MAAKRGKKNTKRPVSVPLRQAVRLLIGPGRSLALALLVTGVLVAACYVVYQRLRDDLLASEQYQVTAENFDISPPPEWIRSDPRQKAYGYVAIQGPLSVMDDDATQRVAEAFQMHPWVERVIRVTKHHPARIRVELKYRRPVCFVQCVIRGEPKWLPVDVHGVWLPDDDFTACEAAGYPLVVNVPSAPVGLPGMPWRDERVVGAAEIAAAFGPTWHELGLHHIAPSDRVPAGQRTEYIYDLYTRQGTRIPWGRSPGTTIPGEVSAKQKIAWLRKCAAAHGGLGAAKSAGAIDVQHPDTPRAVDPVAARQGTLEKP